MECRLCWGEWRAFFYTAETKTTSLPVSWTDALPGDPFVELSQGRAMGRVQELSRLAQLIVDIKNEAVNEIKPKV
jgi:hypothetical protein